MGVFTHATLFACYPRWAADERERFVSDPFLLYPGGRLASDVWAGAAARARTAGWDGERVALSVQPFMYIYSSRTLRHCIVSVRDLPVRLSDC